MFPFVIWPDLISVFVHGLAQAATMKYYRLCGLNNRDLCFHSFGGQKLQVQDQAASVISLWRNLSILQTLTMF